MHIKWWLISPSQTDLQCTKHYAQIDLSYLIGLFLMASSMTKTSQLIRTG